MKMLRRGMAMVLSIALVFSLVAVLAETNWSKTDSIGLLSRYYETGSTNSDPGIISTVPGDPGGKSYGVYMFASNPGTVMAFINWCLSRDSGSAAFGIGERLLSAYKVEGGYGTIFDDAWKYEADKDPTAFLSAQEGYAGAEIYDEALKCLRELGIDLPANYYSSALKNVIWSRAVHHGPSGAAYMIRRAFERSFGAGGFRFQSEGDLIEAIHRESGRVVTYAELATELRNNGSIVPAENALDTMSGPLAEKYGVNGKILRYWYGSSGGVQLSVYRRLNVYEIGDALTLLKNNAMPEENQPAPGNYKISLQATQLLYLQSALVDSTANLSLNTENAGKFTLTYLAGADAYTISTVVGDSTLRLSADDNGVISLATPNNNDRQLWHIEQDGSNGWTVRNKFAVYRAANLASDPFVPTYLSYQDNTLKLVAPAEAIPAEGEALAVPAVVPSTWLFTAVTEEKSDWTLRWVIAPQKDVNTIIKNDSAFPVRGLISCSSPISNVTLTISKQQADQSYAPVSYVSHSANLPSNTNSYAFDLKDMDSYISYSRLEQGTYKYVLSATAGSITFDSLVETTFTVGAAGTSAPPVIITPPSVNEEELPPVEIPPTEDSECVTVAFHVGDYGNCATTSKTFSLDDIVYGELPLVQANSGWRFMGWFTAPDDEGEKLYPDSKIPAASMVVYAHYTKINNYKFLNAAGGTFTISGSTGTAAPGELIEKPSETPIKNPDSTYTYTFSHWVDAAGNKYPSNVSIVMGQNDMVFTPIYTATKKPADSSKPDVTPTPGGNNTGGSSSGSDSSTTTPSGNLWTISPGTSISQLSSTVYSNGKVVTSGNLATGMTTTMDGKEYVITVKGDTSGDGKITVTDVVKLQSHLLNKTSLSGAYLKAADLNGDSKVSITDLVKSARVVAGKDTIG